MLVPVHFYSYFKELAGCGETAEPMAEGGTLNDLFQQLIARFPKLAEMQKCALMAVGVEYQPRGYVLKPGDEVSLSRPSKEDEVAPSQRRESQIQAMHLDGLRGRY